MSNCTKRERPTKQKQILPGSRRGKNDERRLLERKKRRQRRQKKAEEEKKKPKSALAESLKEAMGTDESRKRGDKSKKSKKEDKDDKDGDDAPKKKILNGVDEGEVYKDFADTFAVKETQAKKETKAAAGTIEACREA